MTQPSSTSHIPPRLAYRNHRQRHCSRVPFLRAILPQLAIVLLLSSCTSTKTSLLKPSEDAIPYVVERSWERRPHSGKDLHRTSRFVTTRRVDWGQTDLRVTPFVDPVTASEAAHGALFTGSPLAAEVRRAGQLLQSGTVAESGNRLMIINTGYDALLMRVHLIRNARHSINVQTFVWLDDEVGRLMMRELIAAAERGVQVRAIMDHYGSEQSLELAAHFANRHPNLTLKIYRPLAHRIQPGKVISLAHQAVTFRRFNQRMHNKLMTFDGVIGITGGRNIDNQYYNHSTSLNFRDRDALVVGPVVSQMAGSFEEFWAFEGAERVDELKDVVEHMKHHGELEIDEETFGYHGLFDELQVQADDDDFIGRMLSDRMMDADSVEFIADRPGKSSMLSWGDSGRTTERLKKALEEVRETLVLQSPYFILNERGKKLFTDLTNASPGLKVTISTNSFESTDQLIPYAANMRLRRTVVKTLGLHVYEIKAHPAHMETLFPRRQEMVARFHEHGGEHGQEREPFMCIHAKSFVVDGRLAYVGSYNLDPRSTNLNTEVGLLIRDADVAQLVEKAILKDTEPGNSYVVAPTDPKGSVNKANEMIERISDVLPLDLWPFYDTTCFELKPGGTPVAPDHPDFHENYVPVGSFPTEYAPLEKRRFETRLYKAIGRIITPIL